MNMSTCTDVDTAEDTAKDLAQLFWHVPCNCGVVRSILDMKNKTKCGYMSVFT